MLFSRLGQLLLLAFADFDNIGEQVALIRQVNGQAALLSLMIVIPPCEHFVVFLAHDEQMVLVLLVGTQKSRIGAAQGGFLGLRECLEVPLLAMEQAARELGRFLSETFTTRLARVYVVLLDERAHLGHNTDHSIVTVE